MAAESAWSLDALVSQLAGDEQLAREMVVLFVDECPQMIGAVHDALATGSSDAVRRAAHALKGAAGNFTPDGPTATARRLELSAAEGRLDEAAALINRLEQELDELRQAMARLS
jgi:HPt (histidine-containing phosphotransfer) domain-containing protein